VNKHKLEFVVGKKYLTRNNCVATCVSTNGTPPILTVLIVSTSKERQREEAQEWKNSPVEGPVEPGNSTIRRQAGV
jgi:hypothetical protein